MPVARVLFVSSDRVDDWLPTRLEPFERESTMSSRWAAWRLLGGNNREIGRSTRVFDDFARCYEAIRHVQTALRDVRRHSTRLLESSGLWTWLVDIDGRPEVTSGRGYYRQRECRANAQQFLDLMPTATTPYDGFLHEPYPTVRVPNRTLQRSVDLVARAGPGPEAG